MAIFSGPEPVLPVPSVHGDFVVDSVLLEVCGHHRHHVGHLGHGLGLRDPKAEPQPQGQDEVRVHRLRPSQRSS